MRLDISMFCPEDLLRTIDRSLLHDIGEFAAAVVTLARITLGVLIRKDRSHRLEDGFRDKIFRSNQLETVRLPRNFVIDRRLNNGSASETPCVKKLLILNETDDGD